MDAAAPRNYAKPAPRTRVQRLTPEQQYFNWVNSNRALVQALSQAQASEEVDQTAELSKVLSSKLGGVIPQSAIQAGFKAAGVEKMDPSQLKVITEALPLLLSSNPINKVKAIKLILQHPEILNFLKAIPQLRIPITAAQIAIKQKKLILGLSVASCLIPLMFMASLMSVVNEIREDPIGAASFLIETAGESITNEGCQKIVVNLGEEAAEGAANVVIDVTLFGPKLVYTVVTGNQADLNVTIDYVTVTRDDELSCAMVALDNYTNWQNRGD
ncbi:MAG: hypothetical protein Q9M91_06485 [Candidatus Dojkabacteria bacterium]|nr:hypothetical protein [Candidatus Dojkabacteria bacterium]MDQ7021443.1 hypothetical protein [Candidatus Dojkabacteria bacterium]